MPYRSRAEVHRTANGPIYVRPPQRKGIKRAMDTLLPDTRPVFVPTAGDWHWRWSRKHFEAVLHRLVQQYKVVELVVDLEHDASKGCTPECWEARQDTVSECICRCGGFNHGTRIPLTADVNASIPESTTLVVTRDDFHDGHFTHRPSWLPPAEEVVAPAE